MKIQYRSCDGVSAAGPLPQLLLHAQHWHRGPSTAQIAVPSQRNACWAVCLSAATDIGRACSPVWPLSHSESSATRHLCPQGMLFQRYPSWLPGVARPETEDAKSFLPTLLCLKQWECLRRFPREKVRPDQKLIRSRKDLLLLDSWG